MHQALINEDTRRRKKMLASKSIRERERNLERGKECLNRKLRFYKKLGDRVSCLLLHRLLVSYVSCLGSAPLPTIYYSNEILSYLEAKLSDYYDKVFVKKHLVKILFFVSTVYFFRVISRKGKDEFVTIPYKYLAAVIGQRHYPKVLEIVLNTGVLETDGWFNYHGPKGKGCEQRKKTEKWQPGKAYGYKLNKRFWNAKFKAMPTHLKVEKGLKIFRNDDQKHLINSINRADLPSDMAKEVVAYSDKSERAKEIQFLLIDRFENKQIFQSVSSKTNRVFNNISSFQRDVRCLIRIDKQPTTEIDISGSQPLLLTTFYKFNCPEKERFKELVEGGKFYETLQVQAGLTNYEKKEFKDETYRVLFGPMIYKYEVKIKEWFQENYPVLWMEIEKLKVKHHSEVPVLLQKMEAQVVIEGVVREFRIQNKPIITVHDSFLVKRNDVKLLKQVIIEQFQKMFNLTPRLKEEPKFKEADYYWDQEEWDGDMGKDYKNHPNYVSPEKRRELLKKWLSGEWCDKELIC